MLSQRFSSLHLSTPSSVVLASSLGTILCLRHRQSLTVPQSPPMVRNGCSSGSRPYLLILVASKEERGKFFWPEGTKKCFLVFHGL